MSRSGLKESNLAPLYPLLSSFNPLAILVFSSTDVCLSYQLSNKFSDAFFFKLFHLYFYKLKLV